MIAIESCIWVFNQLLASGKISEREIGNDGEHHLLPVPDI